MAEKSGGKTVREHIQVKRDPKKLIQDRFKASEQFMTPYHDRWRRIRNAYHGYIAAKNRRPGRANFHLHKLFPQIELEAARFTVFYFAQPPFIQVNPRGPTSVDSAELHEMALQHYIEMAPTFYLHKLRLIKYSLLYGSGFEMPTWRTKRAKVIQKQPVVIGGVHLGDEDVEVDEVIYDGFDFHTFSPTEVYLYPYARHTLSAPWQIVMEFVHVDELVDRADQGIYDKSKVMAIPLNCYKQDDWEMRRHYSDLGLGVPEPDPELVCLIHMFSPERFITLANDDQIIRDVDNFLYHKQIPLIQGVKTLDPDSPWPIGTGQVILPNQRLRNLLGNASIDTVLKNLWPVWKYRTGAGVNPNTLLSLPNHAIGVQNMGDVDIMQMPEMKQDIMALMAMLEANSEEATGYFGTQKGFSDQTRTATSDAIFQQEGNLRIKYDIQTFEQLALIPEAKMLSKTLQQFMPDNVAVKVFGGQASEFKEVSREDIRGEYEYSVTGASQAMNRALLQKQMIEFFRDAQNSEQVVRLPGGQIVPVPVLNTYNALKEILQGFDNRNADRLLHRPEVFGIPVDNDMFEQFGLPGIPGLDNGGNGGRTRGQQQTLAAVGQRSRSVDPTKLVTNANKQSAVGVT